MICASSSPSGCIRRVTAKASAPTASSTPASARGRKHCATPRLRRNQSDTLRAHCAHTVNTMERQAGLGRSLEDVLGSLAPIESADSPPAHALFGLAPDAVSTNGTKKKKNKKKSA